MQRIIAFIGTGACAGRVSAAVLLAIGCIVTYTPVTTVAAIINFPLTDGTGFFEYDAGTKTLSLSGMTIQQIIYTEPQQIPYPPYYIPGDTAGPGSGNGNVSDPLVDDSAAAVLTGVTYSGSGLSFSDGTFQILLGSDEVFRANITNVVLDPTEPQPADTATINGGPTDINLQNVVVTQPTSSTSRFVTDWAAAVGTSNRGALGLTLSNTEAGSLDPFVAPVGGNAGLKLRPATPEPASVLLMLFGCGAMIKLHRRRGSATN